MSEPRYPTRVSDPDETTRIPKEALDGLRDGASSSPTGSSPVGSAPAKETNGSRPAANGSAPANGSMPTGVPSSPGVPAAAPPPRNGTGPASGSVPAASSPSSPSGSGSNGYRDGSGGGGARPSLFGASGAAPSAPAPTGFGSGSGYSGRSETGYSPAAYPSTTYSPSNYSSLGSPSAPTTVNGPVGAPVGGSVATASRPASGSRPKGRGAAGRPARRARLLVRHIDPWSTLKFSFVLAVAMFFVWLVAIGVLYGVLDGMGVFEQINGLYSEVAGNGTESLFTPSLVLGTAALVGAVNIVLFTALATIGAFVYNICADLVGGIEVTLAERD